MKPLALDYYVVKESLNEWSTWIYIYTYSVLRIRDQYLLYCFAHFSVIIVFWSCCICVLFNLINLKRLFWRMSAVTAVLYVRSAWWEMFARNEFSHLLAFFVLLVLIFFQLCHCLFCLLEDFAHCKDIQKNCLHS